VSVEAMARASNKTVAIDGTMLTFDISTLLRRPP